MRKFILNIAFLCLTLSLIQAQPQNDKKEIIIRNLKLIEDLYINKLNFAQRREAIDLMNQTLALIDNAELNSGPGNDNNCQNQTTTSNKDFNELLKNAKKAWPYKEKKVVITEYLLSHDITSEQLKEVLMLLDFDDEKVEIIKLVQPRVIDREKILLVLEPINSSIKRDEVLEYLKTSHKNHRNDDEKAAHHKNREDFTKLQEATKTAWPFREQKIIITEYLISHDITSKQLGSLLEFITFDSEKAELIKLILPRVIDRDRIVFALDSFKSSYEKDKMIEYLTKH